MVYFLPLIPIILFLYTKIIRTKEIKAKHSSSAKFVIISDIHLGLFKGKKYLSRIVKKINAINDVDAIFILGDLFYKANNIEKLIAPLKKLKQPVYFVFGNHDYDIGKETLMRILRKYNIYVLYNKEVFINDIRVYGTDDLQRGVPDILKIRNDDIVLTHNPDTAFLYIHRVKNTITLSGHTHCGQIRILFLFKYILPVRGHWYTKKWYNFQNNNKLYITCGLGEVYLPFRFMATPEIIILNLYD